MLYRSARAVREERWNACALVFESGSLQCVATDGHRLARAWTLAQGGEAFEHLEVDHQALHLLYKDAPKKGRVHLEREDEALVAWSEGWSCRLALTSGFPDWQAVVQAGFAHELSGPTAQLLELTKLIRKKRPQPKRVVIDISLDELRVMEFGAMTVQANGSRVSTGLNPNYLHDFARLAPGKRFTLRFDDEPLGILRFRAEREGEALDYDLMPMHLEASG